MDNDIINKAKAGDANAMFELGDQLVEDGTVGGYKEAINWYRQAAEKGLPIAALKGAAACIDLGGHLENSEVPVSDMINYWQLGCWFITGAMRYISSDLSDYSEQIVEFAEDIFYAYAACLYLSDNEDKSLEILNLIGNNGGGERTKILRALINVLKVERIDSIISIVNYLCSLYVGDDPYAETIGNARYLEKMLFTNATIILADCFKKGIGTEKNEDAAKVIRQIAYQNLNNDGLKTKLLE